MEDNIRLTGEVGFVPALLQVVKRVAAPDNLATLIYRQAGPTEIVFTQANEPQVFAELRTTYSGGPYLFDPYYDLHLCRRLAGVYCLRDVAPEVFQHRRYFIEYYEQTN